MGGAVDHFSQPLESIHSLDPYIQMTLQVFE